MSFDHVGDVPGPVSQDKHVAFGTLNRNLELDLIDFSFLKATRLVDVHSKVVYPSLSFNFEDDRLRFLFTKSLYGIPSNTDRLNMDFFSSVPFTCYTLSLLSLRRMIT